MPTIRLDGALDAATHLPQLTAQQPAKPNHHLSLPSSTSPPKKTSPPSTPTTPCPQAARTTISFLSQDAAGALHVDEQIKQSLGDKAGLVVVPHFKLPQYGEHFDDTEGRFPMLPQLKAFLQCYDDTGSSYWFAEVLPEGGGDGMSDFLAIYVAADGLQLVRHMFTWSNRWIGTMVM
jgi:hypothetical protein